MKIAFFTGEYPPMPGGVGDFTRILAGRLQGLGHEVSILSRAGTASETLPVSTVDGWGLSSLRQIRAWTQRVKPDIVNLQFQTAAFDMSPVIHFLPKALPVPVVTTFHDLRVPYLFPKAGPLRQWIVMQLARSSAGVITTNQEDDLRLNSLPKRRLIPIGSSISRRAISHNDRLACRQNLGATADTFLLGHFGFVKAIKGAHHLIDALARIRGDDVDLRLVFIGGRSNTVDSSKDKRYLQDLDERIRRLNLAEAVSWTGYLPDSQVAACFQAVDLMVLPFEDGASYRRSSLIAAIHQGCAILTTDPALEIEAFARERNLWLVPPCSAEGIQLALAHLMANREQLSALRVGAVDLSNHFDWDLIAQETVAFCQACL